MHRLTGSTLVCALALLISCFGCGGAENPAPASTTSAKPAPPPVPADLQAVAESELGAESDVLAWGDLAKNGNQQILVINRIKKTPDGTVPGNLFTRAIIAEKENGAWKEIFRCDEHLKNQKGFLASTPLAAVNGWRLQFEQHADTGLVMYFTPLRAPEGGHAETIAVKWNPKVMRYQTLDRNFEQFQGEAPSLEPVEVPLRR